MTITENASTPSMGIEEFLTEIENTKLAGWLESLSAKDGVSVYLNALEFKQHKLQRATFRQSEDTDTEFTINIINTKEDLNVT